MFVVLVDCGYSDWFKVRDMRVVGLFETRDEAVEWAAALNTRSLDSRDGATVTATVQPLNPVMTALEYSVV